MQFVVLGAFKSCYCCKYWSKSGLVPNRL